MLLQLLVLRLGLPLGSECRGRRLAKKQPASPSRLQIIGSTARIFCMQSLYQCDLAYVQAAAFGTLAQGAATEIIRRLQLSTAPVRKVLDVGCGRWSIDESAYRSRISSDRR